MKRLAYTAIRWGARLSLVAVLCLGIIHFIDDFPTYSPLPPAQIIAEKLAQEAGDTLGFSRPDQISARPSGYSLFYHLMPPDLTEGAK